MYVRIRNINTHEESIIIAYNLTLGKTNPKEETMSMYFKNACYKILKWSEDIKDLLDCYSYKFDTTQDYDVAKGWKKHNNFRRIYGCIVNFEDMIQPVAEMNDYGDVFLFKGE